MKKLWIAAIAASLFATACKENTNKNTATAEQVGPRTPGQDGSFTYKATDGSRAKATFKNSTNTLLIYANNRKFQLDKKDDKNYERGGITARIAGDSLIITQDDNVIDLVLDK